MRDGRWNTEIGSIRTKCFHEGQLTTCRVEATSTGKSTSDRGQRRCKHPSARAVLRLPDEPLNKTSLSTKEKVVIAREMKFLATSVDPRKLSVPKNGEGEANAVYERSKRRD